MKNSIPTLKYKKTLKFLLTTAFALVFFTNHATAANVSCEVPHYQNIISKLHSQLDAIGELKLQAEVALETYSKNSTSTNLATPEASSTEDGSQNSANQNDNTNPKIAKYKKILENSLKNKIKKMNLSNSKLSFSADAATETEKQFSKEAEDTFNASQIRSAAILEILKDTNKIALTINKPSSDVFEEMARANDTSNLIVAATSIIQKEFDLLETSLSGSIEKLEKACKESKNLKLKKTKVDIIESTKEESTGSTQ